MTKKTIKLFSGNEKFAKLYEKGFHPETQVKKVKQHLDTLKTSLSVYTNSPFVSEAFNRFGKEKGFNVLFYYNKMRILADQYFNKMSKPFQALIFD